MILFKVHCFHTQFLLKSAIMYIMHVCYRVCVVIAILPYHPIFTGPPPAPIISTDFTIFLGEENSTLSDTFNVSWNPSFTATNAITSYVISPPTSTTEGQDIDLAVSCPPFCSPDVPCQCSGLAVGGRVTVNILAINCDTQEGKPVTVTVASGKWPALMQVHELASYLHGHVFPHV